MIKPFDAFRFFAFFAVFLHHLEKFNAGYLGVQAFFVMSGYLLTPILIDMKSALPLKRYMISFYGRRMLRIFPVYYAYLLLAGVPAVIAVMIFHNDTLVDLLLLFKELPYALTYTYDFYHASSLYEHTPLLTHFWSLAVEEQFYLVWPLFIWLCPKKRLPLLLWGMIAAGPFVRLIEYDTYTYSHVAGLLHNPTLAVYVLPFSHFDAFATGGLLSLMPDGGWGKRAWILSGVTLTVGIGSQFLSTGDVHWQALGYSAFMSGEWKCIWGYSLMNITFGSMLRAIQSDEFLPRLFSVPVFQYLGKISYGLYVYHYPVIWAVDTTCADTLGAPVRYVLMLAVTIGISMLSYELFEKRFLAMKDTWFKKR